MTPRLRILMLTHNIVDAGGTYTRCAALARALVGRGHEVRVLAASRRPSLRARVTAESGVRILEMPDLLPRRARHSGLSPLELAARLLAVLDGNFDVVHGFGHRPGVLLPGLLARRRRGTPYVADWCDLWGGEGIASQRSPWARRTIGRLDLGLEEYAYRRASAVTVITRDLHQRALSLGIPAGRVWTIPVGADAERIRPLPKAEMRRKLGLPEQGHFVFYGGFSPFDGELVAWIFIRLAERNPAAHLLLAGQAFRKACEELEKAGLSRRVFHLGSVPYERLGEILACADVMLLPHANRPYNVMRFPSKLGDFMAAGRPVVTNPTGDLGRLVAEEGIGLVTEEDPDAMAAAILTLLESPGLAESIGARARDLASTRFSWRSLAATLEEGYRQICRGDSRARFVSAGGEGAK